MNKVILFLITGWIAIQTVDLRGASIISNLDGDDGSQTLDINSSRIKGVGFTMPQEAAYQLDNVVLRLAANDGATPVVQIWSNSPSNTPDVALITLNSPIIFGSEGVSNYTFTTSSVFTLQAAFLYWLVVSGHDDDPAFNWLRDSSSIEPTGAATHYGAVFSQEGLPLANQSSAINSYAINGTISPAPESGTYASIVLAGVSLFIFRRHSRQHP